MNDYEIKATLGHDKGKARLTFHIADAESYSDAVSRAVKMIMKSEGCPERAIESLKVTLK